MNQFLNKPYQGHCADFIREALKAEYGKDLMLPQFEGEVSDERNPEIAGLIDKYADQTREVDRPENGDIALMMSGGMPTHVGLYHNGSVIHVTNQSGYVLGTPVGRLRMMGLPIVGWYRL